MPPAGVGVQVLANKPVVLSSEFIAVIRSRRSSEVRPQVEGVITDIMVKSGDRVHAGTPLLQIDASRQRATVDSDEASRAAQEASVAYAQQQFERAKELLRVGAISQQEYDQAEATLRTSTASQAALKARLQESRVQLQYYRVAAPTTGVVGDVPVRVGDRVTTDTVLTTIDQNAGLEVYIQVPIEKGAATSRSGCPCTSSTPQGKILADELRSTSSRRKWTTATQSMLAKAAVRRRNDGFARPSSSFARQRHLAE